MWQRWITAINDLRLRTKLIFSFIVVVFVPVLIVGFFLTGQLRAMALNNAVEQTAINVERVMKRTSDVIDVAYDHAYRFANDELLEDVANRRYGTTYEVVSAYRDFTEFRDTVGLYKEISSVRFYMDNPTMLNNWEFIPPTERIVNAPWYKDAVEANGLAVWRYMEDERYLKQTLSLVRKIDFWEYRSFGVLVLNVNMEMLQDILLQETFDTMIVDSNDRIVAANRTDRIGLTLADIDMVQDFITAGETGRFEGVVDGQWSEIRIESLVPEASANGLRIVSVFSIETIVADANRINRLALSVIGASLALSLLLMYAFSGMLSSRLLRLSKHIQRMATGQWRTTVRIDGKDEIGQLARQFNSMSASIADLMDEVEETNRQRSLLEAKQNEIRFKMMASQINPHFLFNALESIRMRAHLKGEKEISRIVRLLGKMMRKNLEAGSRVIQLADEIDMVRCYLEIQSFRYEDRLKYELHVDPRAEATPIPPLIIQPLVENAVIHGLENKENGGAVRIRVDVVGDRVRVSVEDDGIGMSPETLRRLNETLQAPEELEHNRIGMRNVHVRLQLSFGPEHGLVIRSAVGEGTSIHFYIPLGGNRYV
ncbi:histidine kinase [Paenibacillus sp.]|uniref:sensor histidine kinase n=1 Tax=Paenibacillus sp. TaxID=58172 RepID=UPI002811D88D|nr:histidine kinase [Paenibacillus sp.]